MLRGVSPMLLDKAFYIDHRSYLVEAEIAPRVHQMVSLSL